MDHNHYKQTIHPDESFFHTLLHNEPGIRVRNTSLSWTRWTGNNPNPHVLTTDDVPAAVASGSPFARKLGSLQDG